MEKNQGAGPGSLPDRDKHRRKIAQVDADVGQQKQIVEFCRSAQKPHQILLAQGVVDLFFAGNGQHPRRQINPGQVCGLFPESKAGKPGAAAEVDRLGKTRRASQGVKGSAQEHGNLIPHDCQALFKAQGIAVKKIGHVLHWRAVGLDAGQGVQDMKDNSHAAMGRGILGSNLHGFLKTDDRLIEQAEILENIAQMTMGLRVLRVPFQDRQEEIMRQDGK